MYTCIFILMNQSLICYTYAHMYFKTTMYLHSLLLHDSRLRSLPNVFKNSKQFQLCLNSTWDEFCHGDCKITWKSRWIIKWLTAETCFVVCQECFQIFWGERTVRGYTTTLNSSSLEINIKMHAFAYNIAYGFVSYSPINAKHEACFHNG